MKRAKVHRINLDVYKRQVAVVFTSNVMDYEKKLMKRYPKMTPISEAADENTLAVTHYNLDEYDTIWVIMPTTGAGVAVLVHEVIHAVDEIMRYFDLEGTEVRAYLVQHIIEHIYK